MLIIIVLTLLQHCYGRELYLPVIATFQLIWLIDCIFIIVEKENLAYIPIYVSLMSLPLILYIPLYRFLEEFPLFSFLLTRLLQLLELGG